MEPLENPESLMKAMRKRERENEDESDFMTILAGAMLLLTGQGSSSWFQPRRTIQRAAGGAMGSTMWGYYNYGDEKTFLYNFRMTKDQLEGGHRMLAEGGHLHDSQSRRVEYRFPGRFKFAVCMYVLAHGGGAGTYFKAAADCASLGESTVEVWMGQFCRAILAIMAPIFLHFQPPSSTYIDLCKAAFSARRGFPNVSQAGDGSHVPFNPWRCTNKSIYKNYKGWFSLHVLAYCNSFHLFTMYKTGATGRMSDNTALQTCEYFQKITNDRAAWLGDNTSYIAGDGGTSDPHGILITPFRNPQEIQQKWYNFCHSSTRFFIEETFGRWKNRFRFLLKDITTSHTMATQMIGASIVLHNFVSIFRSLDDAEVGIEDCTAVLDHRLHISSFGTDAMWQLHFEKFKPLRCPACNRSAEPIYHCSHVERNQSGRKGGCHRRRHRAHANLLRQSGSTSLDHVVHRDGMRSNYVILLVHLEFFHQRSPILVKDQGVAGDLWR